MSPTFFQSFWKLIFSQLTNINAATTSTAKLLKDVFSTTFARAVDFAEEEAKKDFIAMLREKAAIVAIGEETTSERARAVNWAAVMVLADWLGGHPTQSSASEFTNVILDDSVPVSEMIDSLAVPIVARVLSGLLDKDGVAAFVDAVEQRLIPKLSTEDEKVRLLTNCPVVAKDIEQIMSRTISEIADWCRSTTRVGSDLELTLTVLVNTPRIALFKQVPNIAVLKEQFLVTLAVGLRAASQRGDLNATVDAVQKQFFFIPSVGVVMDRWLDKELKKYNSDLIARLNKYLAASGQAGLELLKGALRAAFTGGHTDVSVPLGTDSAVAEFVHTNANEDGKFNVLPCALNLDAAVSVLKFFPTWFEVVGDRARLTPTALRAGVVTVPGGAGRTVTDSVTATAVTSSGMNAAQAPSGLHSEVDTGAAQDASSHMQEDLIDVLLKEILNKLPQNAFLNRPYPTKVQSGVYRFGTREVTLHTKGGALFVYRVGGYVSEGDAVEFIAREFGVSVDKISSTANLASTARTPGYNPVPTSGSTRKPMEWDNMEFLIRFVRRGLRARDPVWEAGWSASVGGGDPRGQSKDVLAKFLEHHVAHAARQEWARDLLYTDDGTSRRRERSESSGLDSDHDDRSKRRLVAGPPSTFINPTGPGVQSAESHPNYKTRLCMNFPMGKCTRGAGCAYAHGESDLRGGAAAAAAPTQYYKTRMCNAFLEGRCTRGAGCSYAHSESERVAFASGVVRRDVKSSEDVRLAEKRKAMARTRGRSSSRSRSRDDARPAARARPAQPAGQKPLPYIPPPRAGATRPGSRINEDEL